MRFRVIFRKLRTRSVGSWLTLELKNLRRVQKDRSRRHRHAKISRRAETFDFSKPQPLEDALRVDYRAMEHGIVQMANRLLWPVQSGRNFPAQCADRIAGTFNPQSPVLFLACAVALESHVIRAVARRANFGEESRDALRRADSEANYTALLCALTALTRFLEPRRARVCGAGKFYYIPRCQSVAENSASSGRRTRGIAPGRYGRLRRWIRRHFCERSMRTAQPSHSTDGGRHGRTTAAG